MNNKFFPSNFLFILIMILGTMFSLSSSHWLTMWMGLELNLMSFLPLMNIKGKMLEAEASMKYFIIQSMSSSMLIFSSIMMYIYNLTWYSMFNNMMNTLILLSLILKLGGAPMHFWLPNISKQMPWSTLFLLLTWQKLAPLFMLSLMNSNLMLIMLISIMSTLTGSLMALNQTNLQMIITYSSISHLGWMMTMILFNSSLTLFYFINYIIISIPLMHLISSELGNHLFMLTQKNNMNNMIIISLILSLAGLPPLLGFMSKLIILISLINMKLFILSMFMLLGTLISLYFYLSMSLMLVVKSYNMFKTNKNIKNYKSLISLNMVSSFILYPIIIMFIN
uniref:NADH-ubiquinone oxidoreductase chain 2 n=1 Tax=Sepietta oweniana TaxID=70319 RepID=A0A8F5CEL9_9MOLL|nr:NADH dehydrogenase subunit 2 [Sepietta oweniana]QXJ42271.1 NADH dehydrogenase subunit 2 [Sepietta oweniana]